MVVKWYRKGVDSIPAGRPINCQWIFLIPAIYIVFPQFFFKFYKNDDIQNLKADGEKITSVCTLLSMEFTLQ